MRFETKVKIPIPETIIVTMRIIFNGDWYVILHTQSSDIR
ncbi:hypothetical protein bthur0008_59130 [Bacillus thuringiensis serovar berliner ATCC 10792]|nr:hypothetical protein bthur0008_59130 [Bacillus thuringiensis serovar berliner ATCC 10792]